MRADRIAAIAFCLLIVLGCPIPAAAHEFWIEPLQFRLQPGEDVIARLRVGQNFEGDNLPWQPDRVIEAGIRDAGGMRPFDGPIGDLPAIRETVSEPGLNLLTYYSRPSSLTHTDFAAFPAYLRETGQDDLLAVHQQRGLPATGFIEAFSRCAKALVQVGDGGGGDRLTGMPLELLAEADPYAGTADPLPVRLFWLGKPLQNARIAIFERTTAVSARWLRTDADGRISIPLSPGATYLLGAVKTIPRDDQTAIVWHSYWASLTFRAPGDG